MSGRSRRTSLAAESQDWPPEQFKKRGITYEPAARPKSDFYRDLLPVINSRRIELLDHPRLVQ